MTRWGENDKAIARSILAHFHLQTKTNMKKEFLGLCAFASLMFVSCAQDEANFCPDNEIEASFTVEAPVGLQTRAIGDGTNANVVACAVFDSKGNEMTKLRNNTLPITGKKATYSVRLVKGQAYRIAFFAYNNQANAYDVTDMKNIKILDNQQTNVEGRDAFTVYMDVTSDETMNKLTKDTILYRPFAQLNLGALAEDITAAADAGVVVEKTQITISDVYTAFNAYEDAVVGTTTSRTFTWNTLPTEDLSANGSTYDYLAMNYILVGDKENPKSLSNVKFQWETKNGEKTNNPVTEFKNVPVQRNYRTNIMGYLLTNPADFNITIDEKFKNPDYNPNLDDLLK